MNQNGNEPGCLLINSTIRTYERVEPDDFYNVVFSSNLGKRIDVRVHTTDSGIAVVEAYLYLKQHHPTVQYRVESVQYTPANSTSHYDGEEISPASNYLLANHLSNENKVLVACFISICNEDSTANSLDEIEQELLAMEISCNTVNGELYHYRYNKNDGAQLSVEDLKISCGSIWKSYIFIESVNFDFLEMNEFRKLSDAVCDPEELLFWTFIMCFFGQYECHYPYTLFIRIKQNAYTDYCSYSKYPSLSQLTHIC